MPWFAFPDIIPDHEYYEKEVLKRSPVVTTVQVVPELSEHEANSEETKFTSQGMMHTEGGWPKVREYQKTMRGKICLTTKGL